APVAPGSSTRTPLDKTGKTNACWVFSKSNPSCGEQHYNPAIFYLRSAAGSYTLHDLNAPGAGGMPYGRTQYPARTDCPSTGSCSLTQERQNFANWFTYFRSRQLFSKAALSEAFANQPDTLRLGWGFTSNATKSNETDGVSVRGGPTQGVRDFTENHRQAFLQAIQGGTSDGFTPLRYAMHGVGNYFERTDSQSPWRTDPASSSSGNDQLACRRSYHILTTDGYYNDNTGNRNYPGRNDAVGNVDGKTINGGPNGAVSYQARAPYQDTQSNTLADIAMHFWARDLQTD